MISTVWSIDGSDWRIPCTVERESEMTSSEISGMLLDRTYFNDVLGTYMRYDIKVEVPLGMEEEFSQLYDVLTEPVDGHEFVLPYAGGVITVTGRVESVSDILIRMRDGSNRWRGISFQVVANHPTREYSLDEVLIRGVAPLPDASDIDINSTYSYTTNGWEELPSGDDNYY